jgi:cation diffusion facilitator CzcD-associated flavoprotein CzcO
MAVAPARVEQSPDTDLRILIVGAGFGGIAAAIELRRHGFERITILEKAPDLGGTWFYNSYPGAACDVPSHLYSFSFAQRRDWSRLCSPQEEIHSYLREVARQQGIERLIETGVEVTETHWQPDSCTWRVQTADGTTREADAIILATGQLSAPAFPSLPGRETFAGHSFHSARWDHDYPFEGKRVAVVGTGASAVQLVPEIARRVRSLTVFQRTGNWFLPRNNRRYPALYKAAIERIPGLQEFRRRFMFEYCESLTMMIRLPRTVGRLGAMRSNMFMRLQLRGDPDLRRRVWPDYVFGCKRILFSSQFLPALRRPNVELVTDAIERVEPDGIVTGDGRLRELDCIVWATGFATNVFMVGMEITGVDGLRLRDYWADGPHAHLGITVPGFPNMFMLYGPNTNTSGGSIIFYEETQSAYVRRALEQVRSRGGGAIQVRPDVEAASDRDVQSRFDGTAWTECDSWYRDEHGRIVANWPGYMREYAERLSTLDVSEYSFVPAPERTTVAGA